jgi:hypothetical protein
MAYEFTGFFAAGDAAMLDHALRTWPFCRRRLISVPFVGIGVAAPDSLHAATREAAAKARAGGTALEGELSAWSRYYPDRPFVLLRAECFGGMCDYSGSVFQDGQILFQAAGNSRTNALRRLMAHLGLALNDRSYFAPLQRGYFD